jgi:hypothetical protein
MTAQPKNSGATAISTHEQRVAETASINMHWQRRGMIWYDRMEKKLQ